MGLAPYSKQVFARASRLLSAPIPGTRPIEPKPGRDSSGIALFMVIGAMSILAVLVTEFVYVAQISQKMAFDALDQVQVHYLAKSGLKLSLLRLKAYSQIKSMLGGAKDTPGIPTVPKGILEKIWSFPFMYPLPTEIPGLSVGDRAAIDKFQKASGFVGSYSAHIASESTRMNLNSILPGFQPLGNRAPAPTASSSPSPGASPSPHPSGAPSAVPLKPEEARKALSDWLGNVLQSKFEADPDFQAEYRDFRLEDFVNAVAGWADRTYETPGNPWRDYKPKQMPFFSVAELHMIPGMDDRLYSLFAPTLTAAPVAGININTMDEGILKALIPGLQPEEVKKFFEFRDSQEDDNLFKSEQDFYKHIAVYSPFRNDQEEVGRWAQELKKRGIRLVTDEQDFKITVQARLNQSVRTIEAWVSLGTSDSGTKTTGTGAGTGTGTTNPPDNGGGVNSASGSGSATPGQPADPGLKITFMRFF